MDHDNTRSKPNRSGAATRNTWHATDYSWFIKVVLALAATALPIVLWMVLG